MCPPRLPRPSTPRHTRGHSRVEVDLLVHTHMPPPGRPHGGTWLPSHQRSLSRGTLVKNLRVDIIRPDGVGCPTSQNRARVSAKARQLPRSACPLCAGARDGDLSHHRVTRLVDGEALLGSRVPRRNPITQNSCEADVRRGGRPRDRPALSFHSRGASWPFCLATCFCGRLCPGPAG